MGQHTGTCKRCGKQTEYAYLSWVRDYCSHACSNAAKWDVRPRGKTVTIACANCRAGFTLLESHLRARKKHGAEPKYCGYACAGVTHARPERFVVVNCTVCSSVVRRHVARLGEAAYCSRPCQSAGMSTPGSKWSSQQPDKAAQREYMSAYVRRNRNRHNELSRAWAKSNRQYRNFIQQVRRASGQITMEQWLAVFDRCGNACVACGATESLHVDHIVAVAVGGRTEPSNLQLLCGSCNSSKGVKPFAEWMLWRHGIEVLETKA